MDIMVPNWLHCLTNCDEQFVSDGLRWECHVEGKQHSVIWHAYTVTSDQTVCMWHGRHISSVCMGSLPIFIIFLHDAP